TMSKGTVSTTAGATPFYTNSSNPQTTISLQKGQSQLINFTVNATGSAGVYEFFVFANLTENLTVSNSSSKVNITIVIPSQILISLIYPGNWDNFSNLTIPFFNFSVIGETFDNCKLFGNWGGWSAKQTINSPTENITLNFSSETMPDDGYYIWNVLCTDNFGNSAFNSTNFTFAAFLFPDSLDPFLINIYQTKEDGTGEVILNWSVADHSDYYKIYSTDNLSNPFTFLAQTKSTNYTDSLSNLTRRNFYQISNWNPTGENFSNLTLGKTIYYLKRKPNVNTRNWIGFYLQNNLTTANENINQMLNLTAFTMWNTTIQKRLTCNTFSCPDFPSCTETNCDFNLSDGVGYEVNLNLTSSVFTNWSIVGILKDKASVPLIKNSTSFGKNWVSLHSNSSLQDAQGLISSVSYADAVTDWDSNLQTSQGLIPSPFPWSPYIGTNFLLEPEKGYEISVNESSIYDQS
ncbi:MAG TPA: hypothetical protein VJ438_02560, partial [Candidatus Nanoarchaeia archaeon]|nr:hypothetical protein [Candidatus Nanoarchaeia archaeon]